MQNLKIYSHLLCHIAHVRHVCSRWASKHTANSFLFRSYSNSHFLFNAEHIHITQNCKLNKLKTERVRKRMRNNNKVKITAMFKKVETTYQKSSTACESRNHSKKVETLSFQNRSRRKIPRFGHGMKLNHKTNLKL